MLSKKIKMIGLASILSLGAVCGAVVFNEVAPDEVVAANTVHDLNAAIDVNAKTMKVNGSSQSVFNQSFGIDVEKRESKAYIETIINFKKNFENFTFSIQQIKSIDISYVGNKTGLKLNVYDNSVDHGFASGEPQADNKVVFRAMQNFKDVNSLKFKQDLNKPMAKKINIESVNIEFTCQD